MGRRNGLISRVVRASLGSLAGGGAALFASRWARDQLDFDDPASAFKDLQGLFGTAALAAIGFGLATGVWFALGKRPTTLATALLTPAMTLGFVLATVTIGPNELGTTSLLAVYATAGAASSIATFVLARRQHIPM